MRSDYKTGRWSSQGPAIKKLNSKYKAEWNLIYQIYMHKKAYLVNNLSVEGEWPLISL